MSISNHERRVYVEVWLSGVAAGIAIGALLVLYGVF